MIFLTNQLPWKFLNSPVVASFGVTSHEQATGSRSRPHFRPHCSYPTTPPRNGHTTHCCLRPACQSSTLSSHPPPKLWTTRHRRAHLKSATSQTSSQTNHNPKNTKPCSFANQTAKMLIKYAAAARSPAQTPPSPPKILIACPTFTQGPHAHRQGNRAQRRGLRSGTSPLPLTRSIKHPITDLTHMCMLTPKKGLQNQRTRRRKGRHPPGAAAPHLRRQADVRDNPFLLLTPYMPWWF